MKKTACVLLSFLLLFVLNGCITINLPADVLPETSSLQATFEPTASPVVSPLAQPDLAGTPVPVFTPAPQGPQVYSSFAYMVSLDVAVGTAEFDYFDMLRGDDAVQWLVKQEGYSEADAEAEVAEFADSEFIEKNTDPQLRTIDLTDIPLKLMYYPDGSQVEGAQAVDADYADLYTLYELDPSLVLHTFFYHITAQDGEAVSVEQVYWP